MAKRWYISVIKVLIELDDAEPGLSNEPSAACDAVSEHLRESKEFKDWGYVLGPVEVPCDDRPIYEEGDVMNINNPVENY